MFYFTENKNDEIICVQINVFCIKKITMREFNLFIQSLFLFCNGRFRIRCKEELFEVYVFMSCNESNKLSFLYITGALCYLFFFFLNVYLWEETLASNNAFKKIKMHK